MENNAAVTNDPSGTGNATGAEPAAPAPGEVLRKAREARGESLSDAVQALKLSYQQLEALENGKFDALPGPTFVRGFLRNYARHLGLDPEPLLAGLGGQVSKTVDLTLVSNGGGGIPVAPVVNAPSRRSALPALLIVLALAAAVGGGFFLGWFEIPHRLTDAAPEGDNEFVQHDEVVQHELPPPMIPEGENPASEPLDITVEALPASGRAQTAEPAAAEATPAAPEISTLRFTFSASAWVQVREGSEGSGKLLFVGTGNAGSTRNIRGAPPFSLVVAKANKVALEYNGKPVDLKSHVDDNGIAHLILQ
jgi:cytoskeleton protein RodZ